jgi:glycosyltransferase involved in cell wall biosynthesis
MILDHEERGWVLPDSRAKDQCEMKLSLVICTRNRASQLTDTLRSVTRLQYSAPWELVVVDNASNDETQNVIKSFREGLPIKTVIEPHAGLGRARNRGWAMSRGDIVAFTDDDCYPAPDFLSSVLLCFGEDPRLGFIGGRILLHDPEDEPVTIQERACRLEILPGEFMAPGLIQGANLACRRAALESVGGFDERFGAGAFFACEDIDVVARMSARGWHGAYDPRPLVYHHHRRKADAAVALMKLYDRARGAYYVKCILNPKLRKLYLWKWCKILLGQPYRKTARELAAAAEFLVRCAGTQF